jgi:DNA-directed RNA polymerase subunit RPC12/RpoP
MFEWSRYGCRACKRSFVLMKLSEEEEKGKFAKCRFCGTKNSLTRENISSGRVTCTGCGSILLFTPESREELLSPRCVYCGQRLIYKLRTRRKKTVKAV